MGCAAGLGDPRAWHERFGVLVFPMRQGRRHLYFCSFAAALMLTAGACSPAAPTDEATGEHREGDYVAQGNSPFLWAALSPEDFELQQPRPAEQVGAGIYSGPQVSSLQSLLDRYDGVVRDRYLMDHGEALAAPKPVARYVETSALNAWVAPATACLSHQDATAQSGTQFVKLSSYFEEASSCGRAANWTSFVNFPPYWETVNASCSFTGSLESAQPSSNCASEHRAFKDHAPGATIALEATGNFISFSSAMINRLSDEGLAIVAAHELAHYYRAHESPGVRNRTLFWYRYDPQNPFERTPAADTKTIEEQFNAIAPALQSGGVHRSISKLYSPRLGDFIWRIARLLRNGTTDCGAGLDIAMGQHALLDEPAATPGYVSAFRATERALRDCAADVTLTESPEGPLSQAALSEVLTATELDALAGSVVLSSPNLGALLAELDAAAKQLDQSEQALLTTMSDNSIGLYTFEQEADEIALDLATHAGFSVDAMMRGWIDFMRAGEEAGMIDPVADADTCASWMDNDFIDPETGAMRYVALGELWEPHHASCYRLFNLWREAKDHAY